MTSSKKNSIIAIALSAAVVLSLSALPANAAAKPKVTPKPTVSTAPKTGGFGAGGNSAAFAKYTACLAKAGIKLPAFGGGRGFGTPGTRPTGAPNTGGAPRPRTTPSLTPAQQKAYASCASLRPSFGGFGRGTGTGGAAGANPGAIAPKAGAGVAFVACLNAHGIPIKAATDVAGLDVQNTKVIAAMKACAGK